MTDILLTHRIASSAILVFSVVVNISLFVHERCPNAFSCCGGNCRSVLYSIETA